MSKKPKPPKAPQKPRTPQQKRRSKICTIILIVLLLALAGGAYAMYYFATHQPEVAVPEPVAFPDPIYSTMTGYEITDASLNRSPVYCVQIPNGSTDGARPQAGLTDAIIVFEAIAEAGITRFAAIFQNPTVSVIGPVRSLRPYYLDWDTPFDCTVTHAGGSDEALAAIRRGGQRNLDENYTYMWRETGSPRAWNNLFTSPALLTAFNQANGYTTSNPKTFPRTTPDDNQAYLSQRTYCETAGVDADGNPPEGCEAPYPSRANSIAIDFSTSWSHNVRYSYDSATNTYLRSHGDGQPHLSYACPAGLDRPNTMASCGEPRQVAPGVVVAMHIQESTMADNYHEQITTIGSGIAEIFQNGEVVKGKWSKSSQNSQIVFTDSAGQPIQFVPGQVWISAVPQFGGVSYQ